MNRSAGLLMYRRLGSVDASTTEVFLVHPGGPFFTNKDEGHWGIPKGLVDQEEDYLVAAQREFSEEVGFAPPGPFLPIGEVKLKSGKRIHGWAFEVEKDREIILHSNEFSIEWPPKSGEFKSFPEVDRGEFFSWIDAEKKITSAQKPFLDRLKELLSSSDLKKSDSINAPLTP